MRSILIWSLMLVSSCVLSVTRAESAVSLLRVVIVNGPFAGTYDPPAGELICMHAKKQRVYTVAWKNFNAHGAKALAEAGIEVANPDTGGLKQGTVRVSFGDPDKNPLVYEVSGAPVKFATAGKTASISFDGQTKEGIRLKLTATCGDTEEL